MTLPILEKAIGQAKKARMEVLDLINKTIDGPRKNVSVHAPKIKMTKVPVEKIGELIGPGGRVIKALIAETGAMIDVEDDGTVSISGVKEEEVDGALNKINAMMREPKAGEIYEGTVARLQPFGAFVEILPGKDGLVHVSDMSMDFVKDPRDIVNEGDKVTVRVKEIDNMGRINLSMLLDPAADAAKAEKRDSGGGGGGGDRGGFRQGSQSFGGRSSGGGFNRGGRSSGGRDMRGGRGRQDRNDRGNADRGGRGSVGGPHFPTSRLLSDSDR
ncbi:MAG: Polyribonucleotide nucleotidyltransferase [Microgenomates group bacterium GW2011_GWC1_37_12b]|nr:MAG: Polyribonucleotide nucleotidyltransferase [Microgenomates group bacterium GW2011_GWC1_37_12b]